MNSELAALRKLFDNGPVTVLTGAGISTDSGIPDYRGEGSPARTPMNVEQFLGDEQYRQRFWAGTRVWTEKTQQIRPNVAHKALAQLEEAGLITGVITQNTDNLHIQAGTKQIAELHGNGMAFRCVDNGHRWTRREVLKWFDQANPGYAQMHVDAELAPDADAVVKEVEGVKVPVCPACASLLRPDIVYFGEHVPLDTFARAEQILGAGSALLIAGSSLAVNTPIRLVNRAERQGLPLAVINRGPTAIDERPSVQVRVEGNTSDWLPTLAQELLGD